jgi:hypothetical protein
MLPPTDENLRSGLPDLRACADVASGTDRLYPWRVQAGSISEVRAFASDLA